jgi:chaperone required for assembly of F1-ATPase
MNDDPEHQNPTLRQDLTAGWFGDGEDPARLDPVRAARAASAPKRPKRFYADVAIARRDEGFALLLDGKLARTKLRHPLVAETEGVAALLAAEWAAQGEFIVPATMPVTRMLHAAIDHVAGAMAETRADIVNFAQSDLVCYRTREPERLVALQHQHWDPVLRHAEVRYGGRFILCEGIRFVEQPAEAIAGVRTALEQVVSPAELAARHVLTTLSGSALIGLGVADGSLSADAGFDAGEIDADFEASIWGDDEEAAERRAGRLADFRAAAALIRALAD